MLRAKTAGEIEAMAAAGSLVVAVHDAIARGLSAGVSTLELDAIAGGVIADAGATSSFLGHHGFPRTICTSVNDVIIHGIPSEIRLRDGDVISIDVGVVLDGWHGDAAWTYPVGTIDATARNLLDGTEAALIAAIQACQAGDTLPAIGRAVEQVAADHGLGVVADYGGHGIGRSMWEEPHVPNIADRAEPIGMIGGMTLAIEPMLTAGDPAWTEDADGWTIRTRDGSLAAHFEHDIVVMPDGEARVLTTGLGGALGDVLH